MNYTLSDRNFLSSTFNNFRFIRLLRIETKDFELVDSDRIISGYKDCIENNNRIDLYIHIPLLL